MSGIGPLHLWDGSKGLQKGEAQQFLHRVRALEQ